MIRSPSSCTRGRQSLRSTGARDGDVAPGLAAAGAESLDSLDVLHALIVRNLAEDDVLAIEPASDNGGDEELGTVAI